MTENDDGIVDLYARIGLTAPANAPAPLRLTARCVSCTSTFVTIDVQPGQSQFLTVSNDDDFGHEDQFDIYLEVRQLGSAPGMCPPYQLTVTCTPNAEHGLRSVAMGWGKLYSECQASNVTLDNGPAVGSSPCSTLVDREPTKNQYREPAINTFKIEDRASLEEAPSAVNAAAAEANRPLRVWSTAPVLLTPWATFAILLAMYRRRRAVGIETPPGRRPG